jgi:hypothetical protein
MNPYLDGYFNKESQGKGLTTWTENAVDTAGKLFIYPAATLVMAALIGSAAGLGIGYVGGKYLGGKGKPAVTKERIRTNELQELLSDLKYREGLEDYKKGVKSRNDREIHI